jgi:hypothetical protein
VHLTVQARFGAGASKKGLKGYLVGVLCYKNLGEALKGLLAHHLAAERKRQIHVTVDSQAPVWQAKRVTRSSPTLLRLQQARREERLAYYEQVIARL